MRNPRKFEQCVSQVKRSLKKYRRSGNAYAICKATQQNPKRWNPIMPLDIWTATMTPQILASIEKQREKVAKRIHANKPNGLFDFLKTKETVYRRKGRGRTPGGQQSSFEGVKIRKTADGDFATSIDWDSRFDTLKDAKAFIKSWHQGMSNPKRTKRRKNPARSNPMEEAAKFYEGFHGRPPDEFVRIDTPIHYHKVTGAIGDLRKLIIITPDKRYRVTVTFRKPYPILSANEKRTQMFIDGGDQSVKLADFGITEPHEKEVLGQVQKVHYFTTKEHLGDEGGTAIYDHKFGKKHLTFGKKKSPMPTAIYDTVNKLIEFAGGGYTIPDEGIDG